VWKFYKLLLVGFMFNIILGNFPYKIIVDFHLV